MSFSTSYVVCIAVSMYSGGVIENYAWFCNMLGLNCCFTLWEKIVSIFPKNVQINEHMVKLNRVNILIEPKWYHISLSFEIYWYYKEGEIVWLVYRAHMEKYDSSVISALSIIASDLSDRYVQWMTKILQSVPITVIHYCIWALWENNTVWSTKVEKVIKERNKKKEITICPVLINTSDIIT